MKGFARASRREFQAEEMAVPTHRGERDRSGEVGKGHITKALAFSANSRILRRLPGRAVAGPGG